MDFATHQLKGAAAAWWENYLATRSGESPVADEESAVEEAAAAPQTEDQQDPATEEIAEVQLAVEDEPAWHAIPWNEFKIAFRTNIVSAGTMRMKKNEFRALKHGHMLINEI